MDVKQRVIINSVCNVAGRVVSMVVGLFLLPFMLEGLGPKAYGMIPLIMSSVLSFFDVFTAGISTSVGRFVTLNQARKETEEANRYFNTSFFAALGVLLAVYFTTLFIWSRINRAKPAAEAGKREPAGLEGGGEPIPSH